MCREALFEPFEYDPVSLEFRSGELLRLDEVAAHLREHPQQTVVITGYIERKGSQAGSLRTRVSLARKIRDQLVRRGVAARRITSDGSVEVPPPGERREGATVRRHHVEVEAFAVCPEVAALKTCL